MGLTVNEHVNDELLEFSFKQGDYTVSGRVVECRCGRRMLVDAVSYQPRGLPRVNAICLECVELSNDFRSDLPDVAAAIERWTAESGGDA
jgi:hypothetical protein